MRKLITISFLTLDGVMQAPGGKDEDPENGFQYGGWQVPFFGDDDDTIPVALGNAGGLLIGRKTYDIFAGYWPTAGKDIEFFGDVMNKIPKYVASKTLQKTEWENSTLLKGDVGSFRKPIGKIFGYFVEISKILRSLVGLYCGFSVAFNRSFGYANRVFFLRKLFRSISRKPLCLSDGSCDGKLAFPPL